MLAVQVIEKKPHVIIDYTDDPDCGPGEVLVKIESAFVAPYLNDLIFSNRWLSPQRPFIPGQEGIGTVVEVGDGIRNLPIGRKVYCDGFVQSHTTFDNDGYAFLGAFGRGEVGVDMLKKWPDGCFAEYMSLPAECIVPIPDDIGINSSLLCRAGWIATGYEALRKADFSAGEVVAVIGATGQLGSSVVHSALALGATAVYAYGRNEKVLKALTDLDPRVIAGKDVQTDHNFDILIDCAEADSNKLAGKAMDNLTNGGRFVLLGSKSQPLNVGCGALLNSDIRIRGSLWFPRSILVKVFNLIAGRCIDLSDYSVIEYKLENADEALAASIDEAGGLTHVALVC